MWSGPIHDSEFVARALEHVENNESQYGTFLRMKGMLTVAKEVCDPNWCLRNVWTRLVLGITRSVLLHAGESREFLPL